MGQKWEAYLGKVPIFLWNSLRQYVGTLNDHDSSHLTSTGAGLHQTER